MMPIVVSFGPLHLFSYGLAIALGIFLSLVLISRRYRSDPFLRSEETVDLLLICALTGFMGARLYYVLQNWSEYEGGWLKIFAVWEGGLIFYGGIPAGLLGMSLWLRAKKKSILRGLDRIAPFAALVQAFGRVGCFFNGCCVGKVCSLPWKVSFPAGPEGVHPAQLYEAAAMLGIFWILFRQERKDHPAGLTLALYFMLYGITRFEVEWFRETVKAAWGLSGNQWISLGLLAAGAVVGIFSIKREMRTSRGN